MSDLSVEFDLHPSFNDTVWPAIIGDRPWWKKASTWCIVSGVLIAFLFGAIIVLLNGNEQQLLLNVNNQQLELLDKLEKNFQINSAFENKHKVIANEIEGIVNAAIDHHFLKLAIIVGMATVLILTTVKLWGVFKIALNGKNTPQPSSEVKMVEETETNNDVIYNGGQQLLMVDELHEERGVREGEEEFTNDEEGRKLKEEEEESTDEEKEEMPDEEEEKESTKKHSHTYTGEGRKFKCTICGHRSARAGDLKQHMRTHTGEKPFKCDICGHQSARAGHLKLHMLTHTGVKPFKCTICGYRSAHPGNLKQHMRTHTGERPFECTICGHRSARAADLKLHMRTHTGVKPFKCTICGHRSAHPGNLKQHMRRNHAGEK